MKKHVKIIVLMLLVLSALGCGQKEGVSQRMYGDPDGFFANEGFVRDGHLVKILDPVKDEFFIACSIMNCEHTADSEECEANFENYGYVYTIIFDGKMYYFQRVYGHITEIWVKELSGSGRSKVATIPYQYEQRGFVLYKNKLYFSAVEGVGSKSSDTSNAFLVEFDLNTYDCRKLTETLDYEEYSFQKLEVLDNSLYYYYFAYMPEYFDLVFAADTMEDYENAEEYRDCCICKVDLTTLETTELFAEEDFERYELRGATDDYLILYEKENHNILKMTPQGELITVVSSGDIPVSEFDGYSTVMGDYVVCRNYRDI